MSDKNKGKEPEEKAYQNADTSSKKKKRGPKCRTPIPVNDRNKPARGIYDPEGCLKILINGWEEI